MLKNTYKYLLFIFAVLVVGCAKRGNIDGGSKDTIAPVLKMSFPKNFNTNFKGNEIKLVFDEYIKLKNVNKQLIVSPPMKNAPEITPNNASKYININIKDTLQPDTTYSFNFGQSIEDNNEGNRYPQFKYVFSTGNYIDSLKLSGVVKDAFAKNVESFVSVMLYEVNENFNDSIIYKEYPRYITNTLDSLKTFTLENLKPGKYMIVAMKDNNSNYKFDPKTDKIAFHKEYVTIPTDTLYELELFQENLTYKAFKPSVASGNRLILGYQGSPKDADIVLRNGNDIIKSLVTKVADKDSVNIWFQPVKADSLNLSVKKGSFNQEFTFKFKEQKKDTLNFTAKYSGGLPLREKFTLTSTIPLVGFDESLIQLTDKDSVTVPFKTAYDEFKQELTFDFQKQPLDKYRLTILPNALTDFYGKTNDTLAYRFSTKNTSEYGNVRVKLTNVRRFPIIVELTDEKGKVVATEYSESETTIRFESLEPAKLTLRVIYDDNGNRVWDAGSFLEKRQSEQVFYDSSVIDARANWDWDENFTLP